MFAVVVYMTGWPGSRLQPLDMSTRRRRRSEICCFSLVAFKFKRNQRTRSSITAGSLREETRLEVPQIPVFTADPHLQPASRPDPEGSGRIWTGTRPSAWLFHSCIAASEPL